MKVRKSRRYQRLVKRALELPGGKEAYEHGRQSVRTKRASKEGAKTKWTSK